MSHFPKKIADERGADIALVDERGETTWQALDERSNRLVNAFRDLGLAAGDVIAIYAGNCREYYEVMMARLSRRPDVSCPSTGTSVPKSSPT